MIEVAYTETIDHVTEKVRDYWLVPGRVHDVIVVKIDPVPQGQIPSRMKVSCIYTSSNYYLYNILKNFNPLQAWHYCFSDRRTRNTLPVRTEVMLNYYDSLFC